MNKQLKLLQRSKVLKTLEVEKVKHDLSKIKNSTIVMVAYDDATDKFLIGDNSGDLYVATSEYLKSLDIKNSSINSIINGLTKSSIAQHFNKISLQEAKEMFGKKYLYYWSANNRIYGVKRGLIERLDNGPDDTTVVNLWSRTENVLSNDRGVTGLRDVKFSSELRPAFLTFDEEAIPTYTRDQNLVVRDPVKIADIMNKDIQNHDYVPKDDKYGYDMKDSNAVMKAYLGTDDLVVLSNIDKRQVIDIDPPNTDPDNPYVVFNNNTPFNHNYNMVWSTIRSARLFEEFNDEANDNNSNFANMTRHEQNELTNFTSNKHVDTSGLYANIPNLSDAYTTYIESDTFGDKQIYNNGSVGVSIKNEIKWSLDSVNGNTCQITKRVYNSITGEVTNAKRTYDGVVDFEIVNIKDTTARIKKTFRIPILNNAICDFNKFEYKHDATGAAISLPIPAEYEDGIVEYNLDTSTYEQGTNGTISYGMRKVFIQSGATKYFLNSTNGTGTAAFSAYTLTASNVKSATIKRDTEIIFKNTDNTNYSYKTTNNAIDTGSVEYLVANAPTGVKNGNHISRHTRNIHYMSGSTDVICNTAFSDPIVNYEIYTLAVNETTAILKGSSTGVFNTIDKGIETETSYNIVQSRHIEVTSNPITYTRNAETYTSATNIKCSQTMNIDYSYGGVTIRKTITEEAPITHSVFTLEANATIATIKREFRPVFYTYSAGVKSSTSIYKNDVIEIDRNQTANVTYTVSDTATGVSGSNHLATHTRKVVYKQDSVSVNVNTISVDAVINYKIYTLELNKTTATFVGSSTGIFKTYKNGSETSTTYNVAKTDHISVTSAPGTYSNSAVTYSSSSATCTRTLSFGYTYKNVTVKLSIAKSAAVSHSLYNLTSDGATVKRVYKPVFKTITNGAETPSIYVAKEVTIDTNQSATVNYSVASTPTGVKDGNHYSTHTRTVTYKPTSTSQTYSLFSDSVDAVINYKIYTLELNKTTATFVGSSTGIFKTYKNGSKTSTTYNVAKTNHISVTSAPGTYYNSGVTYTSSSATCTRTLSFGYTYKNVTVKLSIAKSAAVSHSLYNLTVSNATVKRVYTPVFKTITNGVETTSNYEAEEVTIDTNEPATVNYSVASTVDKAENGNHYSTHTRTVTYKPTSTSQTYSLLSDSVLASVNYKIYTLELNKTTATFKGSSTGIFKTYKNGSETSTTYNVVDTDHISVTSAPGIYSNSAVTYTRSSATCIRTLSFGYTYKNVTVTLSIAKSAAVSHSLYNLTSDGATVKRVYTPVFKTITNGVETTSNYEAEEVTIDTNRSATVNYSVASTVDKAENGNHYSTHTRTVTYKPASTSQTYSIFSDSILASVSYTWKDISSSSKQFYGSSTAAFKTYSEGTITTTTYDITQSNHLTVNCTITEKDVIDTNPKTAHLELTGRYTYGSVTKQLIKRSDSVNITRDYNDIREYNNSVKLSRRYTPIIKNISNGVELTTDYENSSRFIDYVYGTITQTLTVANHANDYNFNTVIKNDMNETIVSTNSMNITERLGNVTLKEAASMLLNNTNNAKNKVYIGDYFELGGYTWKNNSGTTFTAGTAKYVLVERTIDGNLIFMSSERHKLTSEVGRALSWEQLISKKKLETILLPQLESILGVTPVSYTRKDDISHLKNKRVFLPTEYNIFGEYTFQDPKEQYNGERQWEIFRFNKEENRKIFRRDVITGNINTYAPSNDNNTNGYWLATHGSVGVSTVYNPAKSDFGNTDYTSMSYPCVGVRPCFML